MVGRTLCMCLALAACATQPQTERAAHSALAPGAVLRGARLEATGPYTLFVNPIAVAAQGTDVYVVDAALATLFRVDSIAGVMQSVVRRPFAPGTRVLVDADATIYVLDPAERRVRRYARNGPLVAEYTVDATVGSLRDFFLDSGRLIVADGLHRQLVAFHPLGRAFEVVPLRASGRDAVFGLGAIAGGRANMYASDPRCACLVRIAPDGRVLATFGHGHLRQPGRLVVDRYERVIVADEGDRSLKVFHDERPAAELTFARLGLSAATDLALGDDWLYVADGTTAQVRALRVLPPSR